MARQTTGEPGTLMRCIASFVMRSEDGRSDLHIGEGQTLRPDHYACRQQPQFFLPDGLPTGDYRDAGQRLRVRVIE